MQEPPGRSSYTIPDMDPDSGSPGREASPLAPNGEIPGDAYDRFRRIVLRGAGKLAGVWGSDAADLILLLPDLILLFAGLARDSRVPMRIKAVAGGAVAYLLSPVDLLPEALLGPLGLADDFVLAFLVLDLALNHVDPRIVREHWRGEHDLLEVVQAGLRLSRRLVPPPIYRRLLGWLDERYQGGDNQVH